ncbi:MAG: ATP-binding protein, partial [Acidimicrobiaceae bacterium]|nr:ATP-binding protein [Acidimicrobiaceae bacterium]
MQPSNPFTPTFGYAPHVLIGRDGLLAASAQAIEAGPGASRYTTVYTGPRGSGKTVLLNEIENHAAQQGWVVVSVDAGSAGVGERISEMIDWARSVGDNPDADEQAVREQTTTVKGVRVGPFYAHRETLRRMQPRWGLRRQLTELAAAADDHEAGVLLSVDEMHRCDSESLLRLANDLQHVSKRQRLPLAFAGASLPEIKHTYLEDDRFSFFRRCDSVDLPTLDAADATRFITESVKAGGGACTLEAVRMLADACGGLPYHLQLLGDHAWRIAGAPAGEITGYAATESILLTEKVMSERVYRPTFNSLTDTERRYLKMLHDLGGAATRRTLGAEQTLTAAQ